MNKNGTCLICGADLVYFAVNTNHKPHIVCNQIIGFRKGIPDGQYKCETGHEYRFYGKRELNTLLGQNPLLANWDFDDEIDEDPVEEECSDKTIGSLSLEQYVAVLNTLDDFGSKRLMGLVNRGVVKIY